MSMRISLELWEHKFYRDCWFRRQLGFHIILVRNIWTLILYWPIHAIVFQVIIMHLHNRTINENRGQKLTIKQKLYSFLMSKKKLVI